MIERKEYFENLKKWKNKQIIKVITGIRRCGKSTLLNQFKDYIRKEEKDANIIFINFEELENEELYNYKNLYSFILKQLKKEQWNYVFFDEIQIVPAFEKAIDSLFIKDKVDIYITGSNAYLLSTELGTLLSGRYVEINMLPFSFKEYYLSINEEKEIAFDHYIMEGGFPFISSLEHDNILILQSLDGVYNSVLVKDIAQRQKNKKNLNSPIDSTLLVALCKYLADVIGNHVTIKKITDFLNSNSKSLSNHTVSDYIDYLIEACIFYPAERYNLRGKEILKTNKKYYIVDVGLRNYLIGKDNLDIGFIIENIVFLELKRRHYKVYIGKLDDQEIDFIAEKMGKLEFIQVSASLLNQDTFNREISPLKKLKSNYKKTIITLDKYSLGNYDGIEVINIIDWLLS